MLSPLEEIRLANSRFKKDYSEARMRAAQAVAKAQKNGAKTGGRNDFAQTPTAGDLTAEELIVMRNAAPELDKVLKDPNTRDQQDTAKEAFDFAVENGDIAIAGVNNGAMVAGGSVNGDPYMTGGAIPIAAIAAAAPIVAPLVADGLSWLVGKIKGSGTKKSRAKVRANIIALMQKHRARHAAMDAPILAQRGDKFWSTLYGLSYGEMQALAPEALGDTASKMTLEQLKAAIFRAFQKTHPTKFIARSMRISNPKGSTMTPEQELALRKLNADKDQEIRTLNDAKRAADDRHRLTTDQIANLDQEVARREGRIHDLQDALTDIKSKTDPAKVKRMAELTRAYSKAANEQMQKNLEYVQKYEKANRLKIGSEKRQKLGEELANLAAEKVSNGVARAKIMDEFTALEAELMKDNAYKAIKMPFASTSAAAAASSSSSPAKSVPPNPASPALAAAAAAVPEEKSDSSSSAPEVRSFAAPQPGKGAAQPSAGMASMSGIMRPIIDYAHSRMLKRIPGGAATIGGAAQPSAGLYDAIDAAVANHCEKHAKGKVGGNFWERIRDVGKRVLKFGKDHIAPAAKPFFKSALREVIKKIAPSAASKYGDIIDTGLDIAKSFIPGEDDKDVEGSLKDIGKEALKRAPDALKKAAPDAIDTIRGAISDIRAKKADPELTMTVEDSTGASADPTQPATTFVAASGRRAGRKGAGRPRKYADTNDIDLQELAQTLTALRGYNGADMVPKKRGRPKKST